MSFLLSPELAQFAAVLRKFFAAEMPSVKLRKHLLEKSEVRSRADDPELKQLWTKLVDLGAVGAALPEAFGGLSLGPLAASVVLEESARVLLPVPLFETITFGVLALLTAEPTVKVAAVLSEIAEGKRKVTGAIGNTADFSLMGKSGADMGSDAMLVSGELSLVPSMELADTLIVPVKASDGRNFWCLVDLESQPSGTVTSRRLRTFDLIRSMNAVTLDGANAKVIAETTRSFASIAEELSLAAVAELAGCASKVVEMTVDYVKTRSQFGRPVGTFQAVQHKLADMLLMSEQAFSLCRFAAWSMTADRKQLPSAIAAAKGYASEHISNLIESAIQIHGGIGFTYEYDLHLYLRRALVLARGFQSADASYLSLSEKFLHS